MRTSMMLRIVWKEKYIMDTISIKNFNVINYEKA